MCIFLGRALAIVFFCLFVRCFRLFGPYSIAGLSRKLFSRVCMYVARRTLNPEECVFAVLWEGIFKNCTLDLKPRTATIWEGFFEEMQAQGPSSK